MKKLFFIFSLIFFSFICTAQTPEQTLSAKTESERAQAKNFLSDYFTLYLDGYPKPILSGGIGGGVEINLHRKVSLALGMRREVDESDRSIGAEFMGEYAKITRDKKTIGTRFYLAETHMTGFFLSLGYIWQEVTLRVSPSLLMPTASNKIDQNGAFAGAGYRFFVKPSSKWSLDLGANYVPAQTVKNVSYEADLLGDKAQAEADYFYGVAFEAKIGYTF